MTSQKQRTADYVFCSLIVLFRKFIDKSNMFFHLFYDVISVIAVKIDKPFTACNQSGLDYS